MPNELQLGNARQLIDSLNHYLNGNGLKCKALYSEFTHIVVPAGFRGSDHGLGDLRPRSAQPGFGLISAQTARSLLRRLR